MTFQHFIITRFNLPIYHATKSGAVSPTDETYLRKRMSIFTELCLPSVKQQTCQDFRWLVLFDAHTPNDIRRQIWALHTYYDRFIPCFFDLADYPQVDPAYERMYRDYVAQLQPGEYEPVESNPDEYVRMLVVPMFVRDCIFRFLDGKPDFILTTRLDNDDALHRDFIRIIQEDALRGPSFFLMDYPNGYRYDLVKREVIRFHYPSGHFTSLKEPFVKTLYTAQYWVHNVVDKVAPVVHLEREPLYIELVHDSNVINNTGKSIPKDYLYALRHFCHRDFGYRGRHLSIKAILSTLAGYGRAYVKYKLSR